MRETLIQQTIIEVVNISYGIPVGTLAVVAGGADLDATAYQAESENGFYFVKVKRGPLDPVFPIILEFLSTLGVQQVVAPMKTIQGHAVQRVGDFNLMVFPFLEGKNGFDRDLTDFQWVTLGETLRRIHNAMVPSRIRELLRKEDYSPQWRNTLRTLYSKIEGKSADEDLVSRMIHFLNDHKTIIFRLIDRAEKLSQEVQKQSSESVLCHSDIHAGNVMVTEMGEIYLIDWDSPILAPKERDLMFIGGGIGGVWNCPSEEKLFFKGYGMTSVNTKLLAYYRYERIITDIVEYTQELIFRNSENPAQETLYKYFTDIFEPGNVLEIALNTERP